MKKLFAAACAIGASMLVSLSALTDTVTRTPSPVPRRSFSLASASLTCWRRP